MDIIMNTEQDFIFNPNQSIQEVSKSYTYYCFFGEHEFLDDQNNPRVSTDTKQVLAQIVSSNNVSKYYIKVGSHGHIYNPIGMYSEGNSNKFLAKIGKNAWNFKEVNKLIFDYYVSFLRTKNIAWLNNAERELI